MFYCLVLLINDVNVVVVGEYFFGCVCDLKDFVIIIFGIGLGSGIFIDGELIVGY